MPTQTISKYKNELYPDLTPSAVVYYANKPDESDLKFQQEVMRQLVKMATDGVVLKYQSDLRITKYILQYDLMRRMDQKILYRLINPPPQFLLDIISDNPSLLEFISEANQTHDLCLLAINRRVKALEHIINQTDELCKASINNYPLAIKWVREKTINLCIHSLVTYQDSIKTFKEDIRDYIKIVPHDTIENMIEALKTKKELVSMLGKY